MSDLFLRVLTIVSVFENKIRLTLIFKKINTIKYSFSNDILHQIILKKLYIFFKVGL